MKGQLFIKASVTPDSRGMSRSYPSDWDKRRRNVYKRDNYTCQNCGAKGGASGSAELHAHHIVPKGKGGTDKLTNLKTVCKPCHDSIHGSRKAPTAKSTTSSGPSSGATEERIRGALSFLGSYFILYFLVRPSPNGISGPIILIISIIIGVSVWSYYQDKYRGK